MLNSKKELDRHVQEIFRNMKDGPEKNLKCLNVARRYYSFEEFEIAKKYVSRYLNEKETAPARKLLGQCYESLKQLDKALVEYKTSLELLPDQKDLVLKVCELILRTESKTDLGRTRYWCERLEKLYPHHQMVFKLKEFLIQAEGSTDWAKLEQLILAEIKNHPLDVSLRERLLRLFLETGRHFDAYKLGIEIEKRHHFRHSLSWYQCLADVFKSYQSNDVESLVWEVWILERLAYLSLDEHLGDDNTPRRTTLTNANTAVYLFDQKLHQLSQANFPNVQHENHFYQSYLNHQRAQLMLHFATLIFKTAKSQRESWREASVSAIPLLLLAYSTPIHTKEAWFPHVSGSKRHMAQVWNIEAAYRKSQSGHVLMAILQHRHTQSLSKVTQHCYGNWREILYKQLFNAREQAYGNQTSHFVQEPSLADPPQENPSPNDQRPYDDLAQKVYPNSLHHLVWLGLQTNAAHFTADFINLTDFRCQVFEDLQLACSDLNHSTLESLDRLDCEAFLHASVLCAKSVQEENSNWLTGPKSALTVPACITSQLCSVEQAQWWSSAYDVYKNKIQGDFGQVRATVQRGIEVIRALGNHGLDVRLLVHLARIFTNKAQSFQSIGETRSYEAVNNRAAYFWRKARVLLQQTLNNVSLRKPLNVLFNYQGKEITTSEAHQLYDEARFFLACEHMKQGDYDEALSQFDQLTSPMASYYQAQIYIKLADKQISNVPREVITSEMRSLHIIYLTKARDALYLTSDRLRSPLDSQKHPINLTERLAKDIEDIETRLRRIKPDCFTNDLTRQEIDGLTDEESVSTAPSHGGGGGDIIGNGHFGTSYYTLSSALLSPKHHEPPTRNFHSTPRYKQNTLDVSHGRTEARPSPERLDAQLRQLMNSNDYMNLGVQVVLRQVLEEIRGLREDFSRQFSKQGDDLSRQLTNFSRQLDDLSRQLGDQCNLWEQRESNTRQLNEQFLRNINDLKRDLSRGKTTRQAPISENLPSNQTNTNPEVPQTSEAEDDIYNYGEEDYSDEMNLAAAAAAQIGQYPGFPGYAAAAAAASAYRQMSGVLGTNTVTYGAPPPLQPPPPPPPPAQFFRGVDPTSLMYAPMGYYPTQSALPFSEGQQLPDFRSPFTQPPPVLPTPAVHPKAPINVVITSSDTLPTSAPPTQPPLSVTIPPQHRLGTLPPPQVQTTQNTIAHSTSQPHQFQISMPAQPALPHASILEQGAAKLSPVIPLSTNSLLSNVPSPIYSAVSPDKSPIKDDKKGKAKELNKSKEKNEDENEAENETEDHDPHFEPIVQMPAEIDLKTGEEDEEVLHECRIKLYRFTDKEWKERGVGQVKILKNLNTGKIRLLMRRDQVLKICANHFITPDLELKPNSDRSWFWAANDFADEEVRFEKLCARFKSSEDATKFKEAWDSARSIAPSTSTPKTVSSISITSSSTISTTSSTSSLTTFTTPSTLSTSPSTTKFSITPSKLDINNQSEQHTTKLGGFTFNSPPSLKPTTEIDNKAKEKPEKPSPFATFSFGTSISSTSKPFSELSLTNNNNKEESTKVSLNKTSENKIPENKSSENKSSENSLFDSPNTNISFGSLIGTGIGFKTDSNFKGFAGAGTPLFSKSDKSTNNESEENKGIKSENKKDVSKDKKENKEKEDDADEFVPTTEFTPVIPLPELVEVRTGEEGQEILYDERVKLLRFDQEGKQWKERGIGKMKILHDPVGGRVRFLMRREQVFKLCCNHFITSSIKLQPLSSSDRAWTWYAQDYSEGELKSETLAIKFKNSEQANEFKRIVEDIQSRMENDKLVVAQNVEKSSWKCPTCSNMIPNSQKSCPCEKPCVSNDVLKPLSDLFKPKAGSWECNQCLIRNEENNSKCVACQAPNPSKPQVDTTTPGSIFTIPPKIETAPLTSIPSTTPSTTFTFSLPPPSNNVFSFGIYGDKTPNSQTTGQLPSLKEYFPPKLGVWECKKCFTRNESSDNHCGSCDSPNPNKSPSALSVLNAEKKSPFTINSNTSPQNGSSLIFKLSGESTGSFNIPPSTTSSTTFTFGISSPTTQTTTTSSETPIKSETSNVTFGSSSTYTFKFSGVRAKSPGKSPVKSPGIHGISGNEDSGSEAADEDEGDQIYFQPIIPLPEKVPTHTGEEDEETLFSQRAKLFRYQGGEWKERGIGEVKILKHKENKKIRILMRRDQVLKICANHYITLEMRLDVKDEKTWIWAANDFSEGEIIFEKFAIRFKSADIANDFKEAVLEAQIFLGESVQKQIDETLATSSIKSDLISRQSVQRALFANEESNGEVEDEEDNENDDDITAVYIKEVTPEEREKARKLLLPDNFYSYKNLQPCPGCRGCEPSDDEESDQPTSTTGSSSMNTFKFVHPSTTSSDSIKKNLFGNSKSTVISSPTFSFGQKPISESGSIFGGSPQTTSLLGGSPSTSSQNNSFFNFFPSQNSNKEDSKLGGFTFKFPEQQQIPMFFGSPKPSIFGGTTTIDDKKDNNKPIEFSLKTQNNNNNTNQKETNLFGQKSENLTKSENKSSIFENKSEKLFGPPTSTGQGLLGAVPKKLDEASNQIEMDVKTYLSTDSSLSFADLAAGHADKPLFFQSTKSSEPFKWTGSGTPLFSKKTQEESISTPTSPDTGASGDHDPHFEPIVPLPDIIEVVTGEEDENKLFCQRGKLYRYEHSTREWKERGVGDMKILHNPKQNTYRLLMRREQVHKVVCNQLIKPNLELKPKETSDKAFCWVGVNYIEDECKVEQLCVRFKTSDIASLFYDTVRDCLDQLRQDPAAGPIDSSNLQDDDESGHEDYEDDDNDDENGEHEDDDHEDGNFIETIIRYRATVTISGVSSPQMGNLRIIIHPQFGHSAVFVKDGQRNFELLTPFTKKDQVKKTKTECKWTAMDHSRDPIVVRNIVAKFASDAAANSFASTANQCDHSP